MGYFKNTIKGISWVAALRGSTRIVSFLKIVIIARLILPSNYGLFSVATLALLFLEIFTDTGINVVLVQEKDAIDDYIDTAWIVSIVRGIFISLLLIISAPLVAFFFRTPEVKNIIYLISLAPLVRAFINPSIVKFQKDLLFKKDFIYRSIIHFSDAFTAIIFVLLTKSVVSLVLGLIVGAIIEVFLSHLIILPRPKLKFDKTKIKKILSRGKWMTGAGIFQYCFREGDDVVVGKILGSTSLGLYQMAYKIATLPISEGADVVSKVTFPVFVKIANDKRRLTKAYFKTTSIITLISIPFGLFLIIFADPIVTLLLGPNWHGAIPALRAITIYAILRAIISPSLTMFLAIKKQEFVTAITLLGIFALAVSILPLTIHYGILGAGISTIIAQLATLPLIIYLVRRTIINE